MFSPFQSTKLTYLFHLLDIDNNDLLQLNDFSDIAEDVRRKLNYSEGEEEHQLIVQKSVKFFHKLLRDIPHEENQSITLTDWLDFFEKEVVSAQDPDVLDEYVELILAFLFGLFDENRDGYISIEEYQEIFNSLGIPKEHAIEAFQRIDVNGDNHLSRYEMIPAIETFLTSNDPSEVGNWIFGNWEQK